MLNVIFFPILYLQGTEDISSVHNRVRVWIAGIILGVNCSDLNLLSHVKKTKKILPTVE